MNKIAKLLTFILKIIPIKYVKYLLALVNIFKKNRISSYKYKNIKNIENKIVKILNKSKYRNWLKFKFENLS